VDEQAHHPFPWRVTALAAALVVAASIVAGVLLSRGQVTTTAPQPSATPSATSTVAAVAAQGRQVTVLLIVRDDDRRAVSTMLIGVGGDAGTVSELLLPRDLLLPTVPPRRLSAIDDPTGAQDAEQPLETMLGVEVDAVIDLDRLAWAGLIDATGSRVDAVAAESPGSFPLVVDRVLKGLPYEPETVGELLTGLGSMARTTVTNEDASTLLALVGRDLRAQDVVRSTLPVTYVRGGGDRAALVDLSLSEPLMRELFPEALLVPGHEGQLRVVLQRAGATLGAATAARLALQGAGLGVIPDRDRPEGEEATVVLVPDGSADAQAAGQRVAEVLGLPPGVIRVATDGSVDVRVLLGPDLGPRPV